MNILRVSNIGGLFHEMFDPEPRLTQDIEIRNGVLDASSCFWAKHLETSSVQRLLHILGMNIDREQYRTPQYLSIISDKAAFIRRVQQIPEILSSPTITPQAFFAQMETMGILCKLYSDFIYSPISLTVQSGFVLSELSSQKIYENCLNPCKNPLFLFVENNVMPLIRKYDPDIIFLHGKISCYLMTVALLSKRNNPNLHICITRHASEYYSLNKLVELLIQNDILFQMIDSIILEYFDEVEPKLVAALSNGTSLEGVPNIIFHSSDGSILQTQYAPPADENAMEVFTRKSGQTSNDSSTVDVHLEPYVKCHWNRCTFCGINQKYRHQTIHTSYDTFLDKVHAIQKLSQTHQFFWFIDEAISPEKLRMLAEHFISEQIPITWQARCRADAKLLENGLPERLEKAGLRELRIGLESASYFILKQMDKFDASFSLDLMENIVSTYQAHNISIHCPMILGFPQEDSSERQKTYEFLAHLCSISPLFTFNLNILNLDISSKLYRQWASYQLENVAYPCPPKYFIDNCIAWIPLEEQQILEHECQTFMREYLYPWMPVNAVTPPTILYRLSETSRCTLRWKANGMWLRSHQETLFSAEMELTLSKDLSVTHLDNGICLVYSWTSHHYMQGNQWMLNILEQFRSPCKVSTAIRALVAGAPEIYHSDELIVLLQKFHAFQFLEGAYQIQTITTEDELKAAYNRIYDEEVFIYTVETDACLQNWERELTPGKALELGVGFGKNIEFLRKKGFQVTGVDFSETAIQKMRKKHPFPDCEFLVSDIRSFPIAQESYSLIICSLVLSYLNKEDLAVLAKRIVNGLAPGGIVYFVDLSERDPLASVPSSRTTDHRFFFTVSEVKSLFPALDIIELSDVFRKEPERIGCQGAFGLVYFLGRKPDR